MQTILTLLENNDVAAYVAGMVIIFRSTGLLESTEPVSVATPIPNSIISSILDRLGLKHLQNQRVDGNVLILDGITHREAGLCPMQTTVVL